MRYISPILVHTPFSLLHRKTWISAAIALVTGCKYSHIAFAEDQQIIESIGNKGGVIDTELNQWFRDNAGKTFLQLDRLYLQREYQDLVGLGYSYFGGFRLLCFLLCEKLTGKGRATKLFSYWGNDNKWFCSELVAYVAGYDNYSLYTPKDFLILHNPNHE